MAILAECDICGAQHRVKDAWSGRSIVCKECGVQIPVLNENTITPDVFIEERGRLRRRQPQNKGSRWQRLISGLMAMFVAVALMFVVWLIMLIVKL